MEDLVCFKYKNILHKSLDKDLQILINSGIQSIQENNLVKAELYFKEALKKNTNLNLVYCYLIPIYSTK